MKYKGLMSGYKFISVLLISVMFFCWIFANVAFANEKPEIFLQLGHSSLVASVAFSPDGRQALSGSGDTLKLWDVQSGREIRTFSGHSGTVQSVVFSPDGRQALSGSGDKTLKLWDVQSGREIRTFVGHSGWQVDSVVFSPDGKQALSGSWDKTLKLWDVESGREIRTFAGHSGYVTSVAFSPDGRQALSGSGDKTLKLWDVASGRAIRTFTGHSNPVWSVAFSPDGRQALSGSGDNSMKLWDVESGREIRTFVGHSGDRVESVAFSPDGRQALSGSEDKTLKLWDVASGREIRTFTGHSFYVTSVVFSPDGRQALSGSGDKTLKLWDVESGRAIRTFTGHSSTVHSVAFSPDGRQALSGGNDSILKLWDVAGGRGIRTFKGHSYSVWSVAFSPDGRQALSGSGDKTLKLWDVESGREIRTFMGHSSEVHSVVFSPDGKQALSGGWDGNGTLKLWDVESGREIRTFMGHSSDYVDSLVESVAFSPDGRYILSGSGDPDRTLKLWDVASGRKIRTFKGHSRDWVESVAFSPDGRYILSGSDDKTLKLWDVASGREIRTFTGHSYVVKSVAFSPDGRQALSGSYDKTLKLWDVASGREIRTFTGHSRAVESVAFSPDGRQALSGSDTTLELWDVASGGEIAQLVGFTDGEWVVMTPDGYFSASGNGPAHINVRQGNKVFGLDQFYDVFYRPDIVEAKLRGEDTTDLASTNLEEALRNPPPNVEFVNIPSETADNKVTIKYKITSTGGGIGEVRLFHNGKLIQSDGFYRQAKAPVSRKTSTLLANNSRAIKDDLRGLTIVSKKEDKHGPMDSTSKGKVYDGIVTVDAISGDNDIGLAAFNKNNTVQSILKTATFRSTHKPAEPHLYIFSVGINEYKSKGNRLSFAVKDAESIVEKLRQQSMTQYRAENIHVATLRDHSATKINILNKIKELSTAIKPTDVFVFFMASHGVLQSGLYSIVTHDYDGRLNNSKLINSNEIMEISKNIKALTQIFIFDTCHAGGLDNFVSGLYDARMTVMARNMGLHMFASASSTQEALDGYQGKNGMFTYTLLEGLNNNRDADLNKDNKVSIYELGAYAKEKTVKYSKEMGYTQTPVVNNFGKDTSVYVIR